MIYYLGGRIVREGGSYVGGCINSTVTLINVLFCDV